jgi:beta-galactosidase
MRWPDRLCIGVVHHATFLKQSPPLDGEDFRAFMRSELTAIRDAGFTAFNLSLSWGDVETTEGRYAFDRSDVVRDLCDELGLPVLIWLFMEITPAWLTRIHPQSAAVAASGYRSRSHSYADTLARDRVRGFIHQAVARYGNHPRVLGYNVGVESGFQWNRGPDGAGHDQRLFDYAPAAIAGFRRWLRTRYGTVEALNQVWRDHLDSFDEAEPPRARFFRDGPMLTNQAPWLDWRLATCAMVADYIRFKAACVREIDADTPISDQSYEVDPAQNGQDPWDIDRGMDVAGTSMFTSTVPGDYMIGNYLQDYHRSAGEGRPFWIWELRSGQNAWGITNWGPMPTACDIARFTWQVVGQGASCVQFWNWRPHLGGLEVGGHGFTTRDGRPTDRVARVGAIARALAGDAWFLSLRMPQARIAILDLPAARILAAGESSDRLIVDAQRSLYASLKSQGHVLDFLREDQVAAGALARFRLLCLPLAYALPQACARAIAAWVEGGGHLVGGMFCAAKDEHGFGQAVVPGHGLDRVFGGRETRIDPVYSPDDRPVSNFGEAWDPPITGRPAFTVVSPLGPRCPRGAVVRGFRYRAALAAVGATVVATGEDGEPAILHRRHGSGSAVLIGSCPIAADDFAEDGLAALLGDVAAAAGVEAPASVIDRANRALEAKLLRAPDGGGLVIVLNAEPRPQPAIRVLLPGLRLRSVRDVESGPSPSVRLDARGTLLELDLRAGDARAFRFESEP